MKKLLIAVSLVLAVFLFFGCSSSSSSSATTTTTTTTTTTSTAADATTTTTTTSTTTSTSADTTTTTTTSTSTTTTSTTSTTAGDFTLSSSAFNSGEAIPITYTGDGSDISFPLAWSGKPAGTQSYALLMIDVDASDFIHWMVGSMAPSLVMLPENVTFSLGEKVYMNDFGEQGYGGPYPPTGEVHTYEIILYALNVADTPWADGSTVSNASFDAFVLGAEIDHASITGTYEAQ